jgi:hypothetical protein
VVQGYFFLAVWEMVLNSKESLVSVLISIAKCTGTVNVLSRWALSSLASGNVTVNPGHRFCRIFYPVFGLIIIISSFHCTVGS